MVYVVRTDVDGLYVFDEDEERRMYQMPLTGETFKRDNKLVYNMLKAACVKLDAWTWIQDFDKNANGCKAWQALVAHYDGTGELNKRVERAKEEIAKLHYKDKKVFPFECYVTKLKESFFVLVKDKDENLMDKQRVDVLMRGIKLSNASIVVAKTSMFKDHCLDFHAATSSLSGLISNTHSGAQFDYANRHSGKKRYISAVDSSSGRGGRGRAHRGGSRFGQQSGRGNGRGGRNGRGGHGRRDQRVRMNNVDVTDPHRNFQADEWEKLGSGGRAYILRLHDSPAGGCGGRDGGGAQVQHRLQRMRLMPNKELSKMAAIRALCRKLRSVALRMDVILVAVHIDMRLVLVLTVE